MSRRLHHRHRHRRRDEFEVAPPATVRPTAVRHATVAEPTAARMLSIQRTAGNRAAREAVAPMLRIDRAVQPRGFHAGQLGTPERTALHQRLLAGTANIVDYTSGVCYDTVGFMLYLDGRVNLDQLRSNHGQQWLDVFAFRTRARWTGGAIPAGAAVGFRRPADAQNGRDGFFHAAVAVGGSSIRAVNGHLLGAGWQTADLTVQLAKSDDPAVFTYDRAAVEVYWW